MSAFKIVVVDTSDPVNAEIAKVVAEVELVATELEETAELCRLVLETTQPIPCSFTGS